MSKNIFISILVAATLGMMIVWGVGCYNILVTMQENVESAWGQVENQYQRRADLVPNLVATVKGYATHEQTTLLGVMEARARATQMTLNPSNATSEDLAAYQATQSELSRALGRLMLIAEDYPDLKANENFKQLSEQLEGTENRITYARNLFNNCAKDYNAKVRKFPSNIVAAICGFERRSYFEADAGAENAPKLEF